MKSESIVTIIAAIIGLVGALAGVAGAIVIEILRERNERLLKGLNHDSPPELKPSLEQRKQSLTRWKTPARFISLLCLIIVVVIVFLPGEENTWFLHINRIYIASGLAAIVVLFVLSFLKRSRPASQGGESELTSWLGVFLYLAITIYLGCTVFLGWRFVNWAKLTPHEKLTFAAWELYQGERYQLAIAATARCENEFGPEAESLERSLASSPLPPTGKVTEEQKTAIFQNGVLNDVATCLWIDGRSQAALHETDKAKKALTTTSKYVHARTWDARGWFWSPAEDARDRLHDLP